MIAGIQAPHDDVAALHQAHLRLCVASQGAAQHVRYPGPRGIHQPARPDGLRRTASQILHLRLPYSTLPARAQEARPRADAGAALRRIHGVQHHQAAVFYPAVGISEAARDAWLQPGTQPGAVEAQRARCRQPPAPAQIVVNQQPKPEQPRWPHVPAMRQHEAQRPDDVGGNGKQPLTLRQRLPDQPEFLVFQVA